jgi:predicted O-methyltransferase YrrM
MEDRKSEHSIISNLEKYNIKNYVNFIIGSSLDVLPALLNENKKYDLIFIDGSHDYEITKQDFNNSINLLSDSGCVVFHDVNKRPESNPGPRNVFDDVSSKQFYKVLFNEDLFNLFNYQEDILDAERIHKKWQSTDFRFADPSANPKNLMGIVFKK